MSNLEIVRSIVADWARGDFSSADWADPQIEFVAPLGEARGIDALGLRWREFLAAWDHFVTTPERFIEGEGDRVLVLIRFEGRGRASGTPLLNFSGAQLFTLREGKVVRLVLYEDRKEALEAVGREPG